MYPLAVFGFDSAWTDNPKKPGAIAALLKQPKGWVFMPPQLATFAQARVFIAQYPATSTLIALDQPTIVNNSTGMRGAEKVAGSIVNKIGGGVQATNLGKANMFGPMAPVTQFMTALQVKHNPFLAAKHAAGVYIMEVFPALALPTLVPQIWQRQRAAKYNPENRKHYMPDDWSLVCNGLADYAAQEGLAAVAEYLQQAAGLIKPRKADQDRLDAVICALVGYAWTMYGTAQSCVIGDSTNGFIVAPASTQIRDILAASAKLRDVPFNSTAVF